MSAARERFTVLRVAAGACVQALHWRALLLWWASLSIVALIAVVPMFGFLDAQLSNTIGAPRHAHALDVIAIGDLVAAWRDNAAPRTGALAALFVTVLSWPWLTGLMVAAVRLPRGTPMSTLAAEGLREYGRQLRLVLWSVIVLAPFVALGAWLLHIAGEHATQAIVPAVAGRWEGIAKAFAVLLVLPAYILVDLTRARIAVRDDTRSVVKAWWRALKLNLRRPIAVWLLTLLVCIAGGCVVLLLAALRVMASGAGTGHLVLALLLSQCLVIAIGWLRLARLQVLARAVLADADAG